METQHEHEVCVRLLPSPKSGSARERENALIELSLELCFDCDANDLTKRIVDEATS